MAIAPPKSPPAFPPNILLITADQWRWDALGCAGNGVIQTPNLDALARRGVRFRNAFSPNPICVPARACIMTGNYPQVCTGEKSNSGRIRGDQPLLTEVLKAVGYHTYALGKLHFMPYSPPDQPRLVHGFEHVEWTESGRIINQFDPQGTMTGLEDYFDYLASVGWAGYTRAHGVGNNDVRPCPSPLPAEHYVDHWIADRTIAALDQHASERRAQPFFMWMSSPKPHSPYDPPRPFDALYDPRAIPAPFGSAQSLADRNPAIDGTRYGHGIPSLSPQAWQVIRSYYYGNITFLDAQIGRVLAHLERLGMLDRTLILFAADHGDLLGDFNSCFKGNHLNGSVRVPMIAAGPGVARGMSSDALVGLQDLLPTFAAAAAAPIGQAVQGMDLSPVLADPRQQVRDCFYSTTGRPGAQTAMITDGHWKYVYSEQNATEELYDQTHDLAEEHNLASKPEHAPRRAQLRASLIAEGRRLLDPLTLSDDLPARPVDRSVFPTFPPRSLGWRWY